MSEQPYPHLVIASLWESLQPAHRGDLYEDPLQEILHEMGLGEVTGGGSQLGENGEIVYADIEMRLANLDDALVTARQALESLGAPVGSELRFEKDGAPLAAPIGVEEGLFVYFDGVGLPDEIYEESDINELLERMAGALENSGAGAFRSFWEGPSETAIYIFGKSAEGMFAALDPIFAEHPLCQNARIVFRSGPRSEPAREARIPTRG